MQLSPLEIKDKLLKALDKEYNVVDMAAVVEIICILERTPITKEALESTRLGKFINELRRRTSNESLAKRAKDLVRRWRNLISKPPEPNTGPANHTNGSNYTSRYVPLSSPSMRPSTISPGLRSNPLSPHLSSALTSPALSSSYPNARNRANVLSPPISVHSDRSSISPRTNFNQSSGMRNLAPKQTIKNNAFASIADQTTVNSGLHATDSVPKTHASNKRLRKDSAGDLPASKVSRLNGMSSKSIVDAECSRDSFGVISDKSESVVEVPIVVDTEAKLPKKRGRKKGSTKEAINAAKNLVKTEEDIMLTRMASVARTPKVKTTQELLAGLRARSSGNQEPVVVTTEPQPSLPNSVLTPRGTARDAAEITRNKNEHIAKFLQSQSEHETIDLDPHYSEGKPSPEPELRSVSRLGETSINFRDGLDEASAASPKFESVEEILARLPPLLAAEDIRWSGSEASEPRSEPCIDEQAVERLHSEHLPCVNGVFNDGEKTDVDDDGFREWHECVSKQSYRGELLHILPYVVID